MRLFLHPVTEAPKLTSGTPFAQARRRSAGLYPAITIAIPAFNRPALLHEALASIWAQGRREFVEVLVCDDGGLQETRRVVREWAGMGCRLVSGGERKGAVANWNRCIEEARGRWIMVLHEDDLLYPWYLETVIPFLDDPDMVAVCCRTTRGAVPPASHRPQARPASRRYHPEYFLKSAMSPFPGVLMRRAVAERIGGFDPRWGPIADYEFWYRLACAGTVRFLDFEGAFYRVGPGQWTERAWPHMLRLTHLLRLRIAREQFPGFCALARRAARLFTVRNARCYRTRFGHATGDLSRCLGFAASPYSRIPSGWAWAFLRFATWAKGAHVSASADGQGTPQIQQIGGGPGRLV
jgi:glycosyltransferase involved in cell wall biosynthesis